MASKMIHFWKTLLSASAFYSINAAMGLCALRAADVRQVFAPLEQVESAVTSSARGAAETHPDATTGVASTAQSGAPLVPRFVAVMVALPVLLATLFTVADAKAHDIVSTQEYTAIDQVIRSQAGLAVCVIDGKSYDYGAVQDFLKRLNANSASLGEEARSELTPLINEVFDKRVENVDKYLDWYYSLKADYESLMHFVDNTVEDYARQQLDLAINDGVDDTPLNERFAYYAEKAAELERAAKQELVASINEQRDEMLSLLEPPQPDAQPASG